MPWAVCDSTWAPARFCCTCWRSSFRPGRLDPHIRKMRPVYGEKCAALSDSLREHCEPYVRFNAPGGGLLLLVRVPRRNLQGGVGGCGT